MNLYVSNLAYSLTDDELRSEFAAYGTVASARVVLDRETGRSRGFGFVEMPNDSEAQAAIRGLEGANVAGRPLKVVEARPKEPRPARPAGPPAGARDRNGGGKPWDDDRRDRGGRGGGRPDKKRDRGDRGARGRPWSDEGDGDDWR